MLEAMGAASGAAWALLLAALANPALTPLLAPIAVAHQPLLGPLFGTTVNPDVLRGGEKVNVIPSSASVELDIRMLPGRSVAMTRAWLKRLLADDTLEITELSTAEPSRNDTNGRIYRALADASRAIYPGIQVTPILTPGGGTDSAYFRKLGVRCYGCLPIVAPAEQINTIHGDDEYITPEQLELGCQVVERTITQAATEELAGWWTGSAGLFVTQSRPITTGYWCPSRRWTPRPRRPARGSRRAPGPRLGRHFGR